MVSSGYPSGHALIIAIAEYQHVTPLPAVVIADADDMADTLKSPRWCGYDADKVRTLTNAAATREAILKAFADLAATAAKGDTVCIYFSGHGAAPVGPDTDESRLVPVNGRLDDLAGTTISATEFSTALQAIKADRLLVFLDACHAEGAGAVKSPSDQSDITSGFTEKSLGRLAEGVGRAILASSRTDEVSLIMPGARNSAFTTALLEGLQGAADPNQEGVITLFNLFSHIELRVPDLTGDRQHPILRTRLQNNLVVALGRGGSKAPGSATLEAASADDWAFMNSIFSALYPSGPTDKEIWDRAGGDVATLDLKGNGRSAWFAALRMLRQGGGGARISKLSLLEEASCDFPNNPDLNKLR